jgi:hypothetical protein
MQTFDKNKNTIYVDMDGVLVAFDDYIFKHTGNPYISDEKTWEYIKSVDHFYLNLDPTSYCFELWDFIKSIGSNVEILTGLPRRTPIEQAMPDKIEWVRKHLGSDVKVNFGPYAVDKHKWAKEFDVLIDDHVPNIEKWIEAKGIGYLHRETRPEKTFRFLTFL